MKTLGEHIQTVGQLREALKNVPDTALLNIGNEDRGYDVDKIAYDGISVAIMTHNADMVKRRWKLAEGVDESTPCIVQHGRDISTGEPMYLMEQTNFLSSTWTSEPKDAMVFPLPEDAVEHVNKFMYYETNILICPTPSAQQLPEETEAPHAD